MTSCLNQEIIKISKLIPVKENSACPNRNLCEGRIVKKSEFVRIPNVPNSEVWIEHTTSRHDNLEVTLTHSTQAQTLRSHKQATGSIHTNGSLTINAIPC